ncbi:hypothetical protein BN1002_02097 [Bacillus sp. B-jedd]|nr:hypothetical protein BN1002_02097 [Bacillus sp. B-jedd]
MKKKFLSLLGGLILGGFISFTFLDYQNSNYTIRNYYGLSEKIVKEWDIYFFVNTTIIILSTTFVIYMAWSIIEKRTMKSS